MPISVQQRVLALHPKTGELRTGKILSAAPNCEILSYRVQFDRSELGALLILDYNLIPINNQGSNWELYKNYDQGRKTFSSEESNQGGLSLANEIKNQMLYYKVLRDKHDNSLINTLQDLDNMLKTGGNQDNYFVKFEHTKFSD